MKKNRLSTEELVFEIISAVAALFYMVLQVYYGIVYGAGAMRIRYPERVNGLPREVCTGDIRKYTIRMVELIKLVFVLSLLFTSICDALGYRIDAAYSLIVMAFILMIAVVFEVKIIKILRERKK